MHAYNRHLVSYLRTYERMGLQAIPMRADSGAMGGDNTHEFLVLAETGESEVFYDSAVTDLTFGDRAIDYDSVRNAKACLKSSQPNTPAQMRPTTKRCSTRSRGASPRRARHRSRSDILLRHQVFRSAERNSG